MTSLINADTSGGLKITSDTSGALDIQSAGSTKIAMDSSGNVSVAGTLTATTGATVFNHLDGTVYSNGGARALNTNYTNSSAFDKIIYVAVSNSDAAPLMIIVLDGDTIYLGADPTANAYYPATLIWPAGKVININMNGTPTLQRWVEYA